MTPHKYPAVFPPQEQETIHDIVSKLQHYLEQKHSALQEKQRQCDQLSASLNAERAAHEATRRGGALEQALTELGEAMRLREGFMRQIAFIEQERDQACAELAAERAAHEATKQERDGRKEQQFISETAVLNAYVQAFPSYGYESTPQAMQVFLSELAAARARADAAERMLGEALAGLTTDTTE